MKRPRQTEDESVLREVTKASDAIRKKKKTAPGAKICQRKGAQRYMETRRDAIEEVGGTRKSAE